MNRMELLYKMKALINNKDYKINKKLQMNCKYFYILNKIAGIFYCHLYF